jgi:flagellar biogenesis protein FliO
LETARQILSVLGVFGLLGAVLWALRGGGFAALRVRGGCPRKIESMERLALTANHSLHLVRIGEREVLLATHPHGCSLLIERDGGSR